MAPSPKSFDGSKVADRLQAAADLFRERNAVYKNNIDMHRDLMLVLFPDGVSLNTPHDHKRMQIFSLMVVKLSRYANNWEQGGHVDTLDDLAVYTMMLQQIDSEESA